MDAGRVQKVECRAVTDTRRLAVADIFEAQQRTCTRCARSDAKGAFPGCSTRRCDGFDSDRTDGCWVRRCRYVTNIAGLCGPVVVLSTGAAYTTTGTALGTYCPTSAPTAPTTSPTTVSPTTAPTTSPTTVSPTATTAAPTASPTTTPLPCCETLRLNAVFCCLERINPRFLIDRCVECGTK